MVRVLWGEVNNPSRISWNKNHLTVKRLTENASKAVTERMKANVAAKAQRHAPKSDGPVNSTPVTQAQTHYEGIVHWNDGAPETWNDASLHWQLWDALTPAEQEWCDEPELPRP